jgi:hypothetical protein
MNGLLNRQTVLVGTAALLAALAGPRMLSAQSEGEGGASTPQQHAEVGTLEAIGYQNQRIVVEYPHESTQYPTTPPRSYRSFATNDATPVQGLGEVSDVKDMTQDALNKVVVVTFTEGGEVPTASRITFPDATRIRVTHGTVQSADAAMLDLKEAGGQERRFDLDAGAGVEVDSNQGLLEPSDLKQGQDVTVYYARPESPAGAKQLPETAYVIFERG